MKKLTPKQPHDKYLILEYIKRLTIVCFGLFLLVSCSKKKPVSHENAVIETTTNYKPQPATTKQPDKTLLCKINGKPWYYTEVKCRKIMSNDFSPRKKFVLNFINKDTEAGESMSLMYNADTKKLEYVDITLQAPNDEPGQRIFFGIKGATDEELAQIKDIGILTDISEEKISGTASFTIPKNSKGVFKNELNKDIVVTDFKFTKIPFEDESDY